MADVTISQLTQGKPSNSALVPYTESGQTRSTPVANFGVPVGAVFHLATSTVPAGYLQCNGDTVPNGNGTVQGITADFSSLYVVLGSTYGGVGKLPDLRGQFIRGWNDTGAIDPNRVIGSTQTAYAGYNTFSAALDDGDAQTGNFRSITRFTVNGTSFGYQNITAATNIATNPGDTRPVNVALMAVIKY